MMIRSTGKRKAEIYRLMRFTFRDVPESKFGTEMAGEIFFSGRLGSGQEVLSPFPLRNHGCQHIRQTAAEHAQRDRLLAHYGQDMPIHSRLG
jgi:hypothetical protein